MIFKKQFWKDGHPLSGGRLYFGEPEAFMDPYYSIAATNPFILDMKGRARFHAFKEPELIRLEDASGQELVVTEDMTYDQYCTNEKPLERGA